MGFNTSLMISQKVESTFSSLLKAWLVSDETINYFCFDLKGFAFLLDSLGNKKMITESQPSTVLSVD